jgi:hypothetical protein
MAILRVLSFTITYLLNTMVNRLIYLVAGVIALGSGLANAHGSHSSDDQPQSDDWATRHMMG